MKNGVKKIQAAGYNGARAVYSCSQSFLQGGYLKGNNCQRNGNNIDM